MPRCLEVVSVQVRKAGSPETPAGGIAYLAAVQDKQREVFKQLELPLPRVKDLQTQVTYQDKQAGSWLTN